MKVFYTLSTIVAFIGVSSAALEPQATPAAKRQDVAGLVGQYQGLLTNSAFQSIAQSLQSNPDFLSAVGAAGSSNFAPLQSIVSSLAQDPAASSAAVSALGSSSAAALLSSANGAFSSASAGSSGSQQGTSSAGGAARTSASSSAPSSTSSGSGNGAGSLVNGAQVASIVAVVGSAAFAFVLA